MKLKICEICELTFTPAGGRSKVCDPCVLADPTLLAHRRRRAREYARIKADHDRLSEQRKRSRMRDRKLALARAPAEATHGEHCPAARAWRASSSASSSPRA